MQTEVLAIKREWLTWNSCEVCARRWPDNPLTVREWQVAELFAEAYSDARIAAQLTIAPGTARNHIQSIYRKTGMSSKVALTRWILDIREYQGTPQAQQAPCQFCRRL